MAEKVHPDFETVIILGAGALGSYYGSLLSRVIDVLLIGRAPHIEAINEHGLVVSGEIKATHKVQASTKLTSIPEKALLMVTTKAYDLEAAVRSVRHLLRSDTTVLVLQNGLGIEAIARSMVTQGEVVRGLASTGVELPAPGRIEVKLVRKTVFPATPTGKRLWRLFGACGLEVHLAEDMEAEVWRKLVMNCVINPLSALFRVPNSAIATDHLRAVREGVVEECLNVAEAEGVVLDPSIADEITKAAASYSNVSSMCQDILKGRRTEIDFLNGMVVELGRRHGIATPVNDTLAHLVRFMEGRKWT